MTEEKKGERLAKRMASAGCCSRRTAEEWITEGRVKVNGDLILKPAFNVFPEDKVEVNGKELKAKNETRLWLYYKPTGLITTHKDPKGRKTVFEHLPKSLPRVISVGRLDVNSEGLLLLTNSGEFARKMELPSSGIEREYRVRVFGNLTKDGLDKVRSGLDFEGVAYKPAKITEEKGFTGKNRWLKIQLTEGKNREIRKMMEAIGLQVSRLIRVRYGPYLLGDMKPGEVRECELLQDSQKVGN